MIILGFLLMLGGLFVWPLLPLGFVLVLVGLIIRSINRQGTATRRVLAAARATQDNRPRRECPKCSELILLSATQCHFCGQALEPVKQSWFAAFWGPVDGR